MKEYEVFVPLYSNTGKRLSSRKLTSLKKILIQRFGGLTYFPQKSKGFWKIGRVTFRDEIVILRVLSDESPGSNQFWKTLKQVLKKEWNQKNVLIVIRSIATV